MMLDRNLLQQAARWAVEVEYAGLPEYTAAFKDAATVKGIYPKTDNHEWTPGFCTGQYWLAYELTGKQAFRTAASAQIDSFLKRVEQKRDTDTHDMGFIYIPSCMAAYRLTGDGKARRALLLAADCLLQRFREKGQFIQAWGPLDAADNYRMIIDCMLNVPLLYLAQRFTGQEKYGAAGLAHTQTAIHYLIRPDASVYHTYYFDPQTGKPLKGVTHQGYSDDSFWARGQAWAIYGLALAYRQWRKEEYRQLFCRTTDFFLNKLPPDGVPYWDLIFQTGSEPKDSSAAAIAVCGILDMLPFLGPERERYETSADRILQSLITGYAVRQAAPGRGLLQHGVYGKSSPYNTVQDSGVDECNGWGDYFYLESLTRRLIDWKPYWYGDESDFGQEQNRTDQ